MPTTTENDVDDDGDDTLRMMTRIMKRIYNCCLLHPTKYSSPPLPPLGNDNDLKYNFDMKRELKLSTSSSSSSSELP